MVIGRIAVACVAAAVGLAPTAAAEEPTRAEADSPRVLAFVGEMSTLVDGPEYECGDDCIVWDSAFDSTYLPLQWLEGGPEKEPVAVRQWWHAQPIVWDHKWTLVVVIDRPEGRELFHRTVLAVYPTADGRFASCQAPDADDDPGIARAVRPIRFRDDAVVENVARWSAPAIATRYPAPHYERRGDEIHCTQGVYAEDLARVLVENARKALAAEESAL